MIINDLQNPGELRVYTAGLFRREWDSATYRADPAAVAANEGDPTTTGTNTEIDSITINTTEAIIWRGFFLPDQTDTTWEFQTTSDDASFLWINREDTGEPRNAAQQTDVNMVNADAAVQNGGAHVERTRSTDDAAGDVTLNAGVYYPICIFAANSSGPGVITVRFRRNNGTWQTDGTGFFFHDAGTDNGYHLN